MVFCKSVRGGYSYFFCRSQIGTPQEANRRRLPPSLTSYSICEDTIFFGQKFSTSFTLFRPDNNKPLPPLGICCLTTAFGHAPQITSWADNFGWPRTLRGHLQGKTQDIRSDRDSSKFWSGASIPVGQDSLTNSHTTSDNFPEVTTSLGGVYLPPGKLASNDSLPPLYSQIWPLRKVAPLAPLI